MRATHINNIAAVFFALLVAPLWAQEAGDRQPKPTVSGGIFSLIPPDSVTEHSLKTDHEALPYTTTAGTLELFGQSGARAAKVFYTAHVARSAAINRPLTFVFNGGPGAASAYLHLGLFGPRILEFGRHQDDGTRPFLSDNPDSWLAFTDLVLIDPVGTGWSRAASNEDGKTFYGVRQDAESLAKVIALYTQKNGRVSSPKYLAGESYGGFRAAKVASALKDTQGILVSGVVMISPMIEGRFLWGADDDPLAAALQLPSLAAAYLERRNAFDPKLVNDAERFAMTDYLVSLAGPPLKGTSSDELYARVSALTGIPQQYVSGARGFVGDIYQKQSAGAGRVVSPYDAGHSAVDAYPETATSQNDDPILDGFTRGYGAAFASYARDELGFRTDMTYILLNEDVNHEWKWSGGRGDESRVTASAATDIRDLLSVIPQFRVMVAHGYSDALTPYGFSKYVLDHLPPALVAGRVEIKLYRGGHMFYTSTAARKAFSEDARAFYSAPG
ncbi:S10 family peptidase [Pararhizobium capsulatum]|uniref:S10 family peptidase n=1 Tax=Pararhizobium capsulatum TaxID=34014 RepID=UPI003F99EC35